MYRDMIPPLERERKDAGEATEATVLRRLLLDVVVLGLLLAGIFHWSGPSEKQPPRTKTLHEATLAQR